MLLWIIIGVVAIVVLGLACSWVLRARGGLESMHHSDPDLASRVRAEAQATAVHSRGAQHDTFGGGGGGF